MTRAALLSVVGILLPPLVGCVQALREPPTVGEATAGRSSAAIDTAPLLAQAERAFAQRTIESARQASSVWLDVAAAEPKRTEAWIGAARAAVWLAGHEPEPEAREAAALAAVQAGQLCRSASADDPACAYWLALALGVQARERRATALDALPRMVTLLTGAIEADAALDHAGPHRVLALVLVRAPGWPTGPGDPDEALDHAREAVALAPEFAPNHACLAEALAAVERQAEGRQALDRAAQLAETERDAGNPEALEWLDEIDALRSRDGLVSQ